MNSSSSDKNLPDDLQDVFSSLRDERPALEPLELDRIKLRAMSGARGSSSKRVGMRSRTTALLTAGFLVVGTGGALAGHGFKGVEHGKKHHASYHQYRPPHKKKKLGGYGTPPPPPKFFKPGGGEFHTPTKLVGKHHKK